jgi:hypothetical protein
MTPIQPETRINAGEGISTSGPEPEATRPKKDKKEKKKKASKGVETLFRTTLASHIRLSEMADRKANLMISINTIVISVILSGYVRKVDTPAHLIIPSVILLVVCLTTIIVSLIATNPTIAHRKKQFSKSTAPPVDLLFFGYYSQLTADEYRLNLRQLLSNEEDIYTSLIDNIYAQGQVLARKYRLLKFAYQFFMIGLSAVVIMAAAVLIISH